MIFGAQYYRPPFPGRERWRQDLEHMHALGFNTVKHWVVWNWVERRPGEFEFHELDELVDLSGQCGLQVVLNLIPEGAPYWTSGQEEMFYQTASGEVLRYSGPANIPSAGWPGLCPDNPEAQQMICRFIQTVAEHFADHPNVVAFDVWNEPHLEPMFDYSGQLLCYCRHSVRQFLQWLKKRYGTLDQLNRAWFRAYTSWEQVEPPRRFGTAADMMDWRRFWLDNLAKWLRKRVQAAREGAPSKVIQTHTAFSGYMGANNRGGLGNELGDEFLLAREVDLFGLSSFPLWLMGEEHVQGHFINAEIIAAAARDKPFYQVELQGGAGKAGLLGGFVPTEQDVRQWNWNVIAAGGKGVVYWQYAAEPAGMESPGFGLVNFDGSDTPRSLAAGACAKEFSAPCLDQARRCSAVNAIYLSRDSDLLCYAMGDEESYNGSFQGIWRLLEDAGIPNQFVHADHADTLYSEGVRCLYLPMALSISRREQEQLLAYVTAGGRLIVEAGAGAYRENGALDMQQRFLRQLLGMEGVFFDKPRSARRAYAAHGGFESGCYCQGFSHMAADCSVVARFENGMPAVVERAYGRGSVVWIGTFLSLEYWMHRSDGIRDFLRPFFLPNGYCAIQALQSNGMTVRLFKTETDYLLICLNRTPEPRRLQVRLAQCSLDRSVPPQDGILLQVPRSDNCREQMG